jgi:hypothetical protein
MPKTSPPEHDRLARLPLLCVIDLPVFSSPLRQSLADKLAGTAVVHGRPSNDGG